MRLHPTKLSWLLYLPALAALLNVVIVSHPEVGRAESAADIALPPELIGKASELKQANSQYLKALCNGGSTAEREQTKTVRDGVRGELDKMISSGIDRSPDVQHALDAAADAGSAAAKLASDPKATEQDKAAASVKFQKAKDNLRDAVAKENARIQLQLTKQIGVALAARDTCDNTAAATENKPSNKQATAPRRRAASAPSDNRPGSAAPAPSLPVGVGIGIGGVGITLGR